MDRAATCRCTWDLISLFIFTATSCVTVTAVASLTTHESILWHEDRTGMPLYWNRSADLYIISLLTALCRGTFALKALVDSQSSMRPRRFVLRTMVVLPGGWILHYSVKPLTIQWRERDPAGQAACNLRVDRHVTFPGMLRILSVLSQTIWNGSCFFHTFPRPHFHLFLKC
jgi:hypothetical protein